MIPNLPDQFLNWKIVNRDGVETKAPCLPDGTLVNAHDPQNWLTYDQAVAGGNVAFVFTENDPWFFLDMDKCRQADGQWTAEAAAIFQSFAGAWGELSQSNNGLHIMGKCDKSKLLDRKNRWDGWLEFYIKDRFVAFGHEGWSVIGGDVPTDKDWTDQLLRFVPQREFLGELPDGVDPAYTGPSDDDQLITMMLRSSSAANAFGEGVTINDLWTVNSAKLALQYPSDTGETYDPSKADMALMSHLAFWTGKDMPRMDRLFRLSGLMRPKYDNRADYRRNTIEKAARLCSAVYDVVAPEPARITSTGVSARHEVFLSVPEMIEHFKGCVYIRDAHRMFIPDGSILKPEQFNATYGGHLFTMYPDGTKPTKKAFEAFTENACHRFPWAKSSCFKPDRPTGEITDERVNIYVPPTVPVTKGDVSRVIDFLCRLLPNEQDREILINYMAAVVQYPGVKFQWAPVIQGTEGNGKTLLASCVAYAIGEQYSHSPKAEHVTGQFNNFVVNKLFVIVEEVQMKTRRESLNAMKPMITNVRLEVEPKGVDKYMIDNIANWFFCTNFKDAVIKDRNDRRFAIFFSAQQNESDINRDGMGGRYFPDLYNWLRDGGGYAHVAHWLKNYPIKNELNPATLCHRAPKTSTTDEAVGLSLGPIEQEIMEACESGVKGFRDGWISSYELDLLMRERHIRIAKSKIGTILVGLGYKHWGRATKPLIPHMTRPSLWYRGDPGTVTFDDYKKSQGQQ